MQEIKRPVILIGGIGGDAHSVGLNILRQALLMNHYQVIYLGTQNELDDFFQVAPFCNLVMISNMDGHARLYLQEFSRLKQQFGNKSIRWYLGGNIVIGEGVGEERYFFEMGFDRVFVKFADIQTVLEILEQDLHNVLPALVPPDLLEQLNSRQRFEDTFLSDEKLLSEMFLSVRKEVLTHWKTGREASDLEGNADFLSRQPSFPYIQKQVNQNKIPILVQPRSGVASIQYQIKYFQAFKHVGVKVLSYQVDSLTRNNNYMQAEEAIRESRLVGRSTINGFPVVNHGVSELRRIISNIKTPLQVRHSTRDPRLLAEISYAGGVTAFEGGAICYNIPYYKNYPLPESIPIWNYVDRLTGAYYDQFGIVIDREFFGTLTATLIPPSLAIITNLLEAILSVQQGVKCVTLGYAEQGNRIQDIAAIRAMREIASTTIQNMGYKDIQINTAFYQYMAAFPQIPEYAEQLIYNSAITAVLSGATRLLTKTPVEAYKIPSMTDNVHGLNLNFQGISDADQHTINETEIDNEICLIKKEVDQIFTSVLLAGKGSISRGIVAAFQKGFIDIPFAPSLYNQGEVITARDSDGMVRFLKFGNLQFSREICQYHEYKMQERLRDESIMSLQQGYILVEKDVLRIARGQYDVWPLVN